MTHPALIERITRSLAYMLRHQPEKFDLELDLYGWGSTGEVVRALNEKLGEPVELEDVREAIRSGDRPRYEIEGERIRALYGHSIDVQPGEPSKPPEFLYVGVASRDAERALQYGLRGGRRRFLHLARSAEEAREAGRRTGREYAVLTVFALDAWEEGINFYDRQALFLAEEIPTQFIEVHQSYDDGYEPVERRAGGDERDSRGGFGRGGGRDPRGRRDEGRDGGRGRRGGRDRSRGGRDRNDRGGDRSREPRRDERREPVPREAREFEREGSSRGGRPEEHRREEPRRDDRRRDEPRRDERRRDEPHRDEPRRDEPRRDDHRSEAPRAPAPAPQRQTSSTDFGLGVFEEPARPAVRREPEPQRAAPPPAPAPEPERPPARESREEAPPFGAGL